MDIVRAETAEQIEKVRSLFREYESFLKVDLCFQAFEEELAGLPGCYAFPDGALLLAMNGDREAGCVAMRKLESGICEMKRLYVRSQYRGRGLGRQLATSIISEGAKLGYRLMRLDTLERLERAICLYKSLGFRKCNPYYKNPLPDVVYWELALKA